ncbi:MAG: response regulator [Rhodospirillales bacterium]|nr:response regulator [Rhodospirillales bacterium]
MPWRRASIWRTLGPLAAIGLLLTAASIGAMLGFRHRLVERGLVLAGEIANEPVRTALVRAILPEVRGLLAQGALPGAAFNARMAGFARDYGLLKIRLFTPDGRTLYSPVAAEIGTSPRDPGAFAIALGGSDKVLVNRRWAVDGPEGSTTAEIVFVTYAPLADSTGQIAAVAAIYDDGTSARARIEAGLREFDIAVTAILFLLFAAQFAVAWRAAVTQNRYRAELERESAERLLAIGELTLQRQRFADFAAVSAGWVWETDAALRLTSLSEGVRSIGADPDAEIGTNAESWRAPTGEDGDGPSFAQLMAERREFRDVVMRYRRADGGFAWISRSARPLFDAGGAFLGYRGADRDTTATVEAGRQIRLANAAQIGLLDELEKTRERLELALDTAAMGWWEIEVTMGREYWSPRALEIWGFAPGTVPDYPMILAAIHPEDRKRHVNIFDVPGTTARRNHRVVLPGGEIRYVREDFRIERRADGSVARLFATVIDLTDIEKLRAAAVKDKATLDSALDAMGEGFALCDADDRLLAFNRRFRELVRFDVVPGMPFEEVTRRNYLAAAPHAGPAELARAVERRMDRHRNPRGPFEIPGGDGGRYEVNETRAANGFTVTTYSDVTQARRDAEELAVAKGAAEQANAAKSRFLATMSHEIRTPMNGVLGMVELLAATALDDRQRNYVDIANRSARDLLSIIDDILDYSRLEGGDMPIERVAFAPGEVLRQTAELLALAAGKKGVALAADVGREESRRIEGDPTRFRQILLNLIGNAVKFTERGRIDVRLSYLPGTDGPDMLRVEVADTGVGIAPEALPRLFGHFSQADESISRRFGGSGLGLAISRELARLMGGDLTARSTPGEGSVFELRIPAPPAREMPSAAVAESAEPACAYRALDILVCDDNEINRIVAGEMLGRLGHRAIFVHDGAQAIAAAAARRHDAILMDAQMPDVDGIEATRRIRALPAPFGDVPIVALTANAMRGDRERYLAAGMNDYVAKPVDAADLAAALARVTGAASRAVAPEARAAPEASSAARAGLASLAARLRATGTEG